MRRDQRLRGRKEFVAVRQRGRGPANALLGVRAVRTGNASSRVGFAVPKKVGTAVVRNRVRRRLRALVSALPLAPGWDIVIAVRPAAASARFDALSTALRGLLGRQLPSIPPTPFPFASGERGSQSRGESAEDGVRSQQGGVQRGTRRQREPQAARSRQGLPPTHPPSPLAGRKGPGERGPDV